MKLANTVIKGGTLVAQAGYRDFSGRDLDGHIVMNGKTNPKDGVEVLDADEPEARPQYCDRSKLAVFVHLYDEVC